MMSKTQAIVDDRDSCAWLPFESGDEHRAAESVYPKAPNASIHYNWYPSWDPCP